MLTEDHYSIQNLTNFRRTIIYFPSGTNLQKTAFCNIRYVSKHIVLEFIRRVGTCLNEEYNIYLNWCRDYPRIALFDVVITQIAQFLEMVRAFSISCNNCKIRIKFNHSLPQNHENFKLFLYIAFYCQLLYFILSCWKNSTSLYCSLFMEFHYLYELLKCLQVYDTTYLLSQV